MATAPARRQPAEGISDGDHGVQFYAYDAQLTDNVSRYLATGLAAGQGVLVVATEPHRISIAAGLAERGVDVQALVRAGRIAMLDAASTLAKFMVDGMPDGERYREVIGSAVRRAGPGVRVYGEMVSLLWLAGKPAAALALEHLWNELRERERFTLLCGYPTEVFRGARGADDLIEVASAHTRVAPTSVRPSPA